MLSDPTNNICAYNAKSINTAVAVIGNNNSQCRLSSKTAILSRGWRKHRERLFGADVATLMSAVNKELSEVCNKLKIPVITCHGFRHSIGTHLLRAGCDLRHIQMILGHEKLNSTQRYTRVDRRDLRNIIDKYHPRQPVKRKISV